MRGSSFHPPSDAPLSVARRRAKKICGRAVADVDVDVATGIGIITRANWTGDDYTTALRSACLCTREYRNVLRTVLLEKKHLYSSVWVGIIFVLHGPLRYRY